MKKIDADAHLLAQQLEAQEQGAAPAADRPDLPEETAQLLHLADELHRLPPARPSDAFRRAARARLMRRIALSAPTRPRVIIPHRRALGTPAFRPAARVFAIAALLLVLMTTGTVYASSYALPGDLAYPVKGWVEAACLQFSSPERDSELRQQFAQERAAEIRALIERERYADLPGAYDQVEQQIVDLSLDPASKEHIRSLQTALTEQGEVLSSLLETVSEASRPAIERALSASNQSQERLSELTGDAAPENLPPGQEGKERLPAAPALPTQAGPNAGRSPAPDTESPQQVTPEPEEAETVPPGFVPPGQEKKNNKHGEKSEPAHGRGNHGKPTNSPGGPPFRRTQVSPTP